MFLIHALFAVALLLGLSTRLATLSCCYLLLSLHLRNPLIVQGGDPLLRLLLFRGMFLPLGARYSLDSLWTSRSLPNRFFSTGSVALILQICFVYWCSVALKTDPCWRREGTAVYYILSIDQLVTSLGKLLLNYPELMRFLTFATLALELVGPTLLFFPFWRAQIRLNRRESWCFGRRWGWTMFAPRPPTDDGWYVAAATLQNGVELDLLRGARPVAWDKPELVSSLYKNERWRKFMMNLCRAGQGDNRVNLVNYLWLDWNQSHPPD